MGNSRVAILHFFLLLYLCHLAVAPVTLTFTPPPEALCVGSKPNDKLQETATNLMAISAIAYCSTEAINQWRCPVCPSGFQVQGVYEIPASAAFVVTNDDTIIVSFRGSDSISSYVSDLNIIPMPWPVGQEGSEGACDRCVHKGFGKIFIDLMDSGLRSLFSKVLKQYPASKIFVTGHSMGGSIATLFAYELSTSNALTSDQLAGLSVYTYGSTRVFTSGLVSDYNDRLPSTYRFVHNKDPAPHYPFNTRNAPYEHVGMLVFCEGDDASTCLCKERTDDDGGTLLSHHQARDHTHIFGVITSNYGTVVSVGCDGRAPITERERQERVVTTFYIEEETIKHLNEGIIDHPSVSSAFESRVTKSRSRSRVGKLLKRRGF